MIRRHKERHKTLRPAVHDIIIGLSDGLTVPFAIAAGLASAAASDATIIIAAVVSEIIAGSISMGLGGYLAGATEADHYAAERKREEWEVENKAEVEKAEVVEIFEKFGLTHDESRRVTESLAERKDDWIDFMMRFELGLDVADKNQSLKSAATIGISYIVGGVIPLAPYLVFSHNVSLAFSASIGVTFVALLIFGYIRGRLIDAHPWRGMLQTVLVGAVAAGAAFLLARLIP